jgi:D-3-phosphoglycerate dehydrogenase / 2-oxoglutarate reductase
VESPILVTDYAWPDLSIEEAVFGRVGARLVLPGDGTDVELIDLARGASAILTCWKPVLADMLEAATQCLVVARYGVGIDNIDVAKATELGIVVTNVPDYCVDEVADHAMALILASVRKICMFNAQTNAGHWDNRSGGDIHRLRGQTLGLVGFGRIAQAVAARAAIFGMDICAYDPYVQPTSQAVGTVRFRENLADLLSIADVVSLHVPLTSATAGLISDAELSAMKTSAILINTARGGLVDLPALRKALHNGRIAGAALDVLPTEPPPADLMRDRADNFIMTPHASFYSVESVQDLQRRTAESVLRCLMGQLPDNVVNPAVLDSAALRVR